MPVVRSRRRALTPGSLTCWSVDLDRPDHVVTALAEILSMDERERAARFVFARDRRRFIVARACLRVLLAGCSDIPPAAIRFDYAANGKPVLASSAASSPVHFNVSHSEDLALIAVAPDVPLGVDVEAVRALPDLLEIATRNFTAGEAQIIASLAPPERAHAFFLCWTRKEAFAKALGEGLSLPLDRYRVSCRPGEPAQILEIDGSPAAAREWWVLDLQPAPRFVGAVVMRTPPRPPCLSTLDLDREVLPYLRA